MQGQLKRAGGDVTKVCYVPGLSPAAQILLNHIPHTTRKHPGTQETSRMMIFATQAYRIRYGTPICATLFLDESHILVMITLSRTRRNDPAMTNKFTKPLSHLYASDIPDLNASSDNLVLVASVEGMEKPCLPMLLGNEF